MHQSEKRVVANSANTAFYSGAVAGGNNIINGTPITDIMSAYISRSKINRIYQCNDTSMYPVSDFTININYDFTNAQGQFVTYIMGDSHTDYIGQLEDTHQCVVGLTASGTSSTDCLIENGNSIINAIGFDYRNRCGKIARIGQQYSGNCEERKVGRFVF
jgi:hypothetical protein